MTSAPPSRKMPAMDNEEVPDRWSDAAAVVLGCAFSLCVGGYQFGKSNHQVYLLDAFRIFDPKLLANDWFTTHTMQYHVAFAWLTVGLMKVRLLESGFLVGHLLTVLGLHVAWLGICRALGADRRAYLLSVVLYYLSFAGFVPGFYKFLQDNCFLPSNVAAVAMLWGLWMWLRRRPVAAGVWFGVAGIAHLNYAVVGVGLWVGLVGLDLLRNPLSRERSNRFSLLAGSALALLPSLANVLWALRLKIQRSGAIPLAEFVRLYAKLRHPHHYDPSSWPVILWVSFLWVFPLAIIWYVRSRKRPGADRVALDRAGDVALLVTALLLVSLLFAGVWYVSATLVQMSLWRFAVYLKLLTCVGAAGLIGKSLAVRGSWLRRLFIGVPVVVILGISFWLVAQREARGQTGPVLFPDYLISTMLFFALCTLVPLAATIRVNEGSKGQRWRNAYGLAVLIGTIIIPVGVLWNHLGYNILPEETPAFDAMAAWVRTHTPDDAVFLIPPDDTSFRYLARRAAVVSFKHVPQLSAELPEWRDRLRAVLDLDNLSTLPHPFPATLAAIGARYKQLPADHLFTVARQYGARYVIADRRLPGRDAALAHESPDASGGYFLYDLARANP